MLAINKLDLVRPPALLPLIRRFDETGLFDRVFIVSARDGDGCDDLLDALAKGLPEGPWLFPEDQLSDLSQRAMAAELTREQLFAQLHQELPYSLTVETEGWAASEDGERGPDRSDDLCPARRARRRSCSARAASRSRRSARPRRKELEGMLGQRVHLFLFVKVRRQVAGGSGALSRSWGSISV